MFYVENKFLTLSYQGRQNFYHIRSKALKKHICKNLAKYCLSHHAFIMTKETQTSVIFPSHEALIRTDHGQPE